MLLLGYAVEMYLKAGIAKAYHGCSEEMFERDTQYRFGHRQLDMAKEIAFPFGVGDSAHFKAIEKMVRIDARYPLSVPDSANFADEINAQTRRVWSAENYDEFCDVANRVRRHADAIDQDRHDPAFFLSRRLGEDGYLIFRIGGHLPPRITYRQSATQHVAGGMTPEQIKSLFDGERYIQLHQYWQFADILEDTPSKTKVWQKRNRTRP